MAALGNTIGANSNQPGKIVSAAAGETRQQPSADSDLLRNQPNRSSRPEPYVDAKGGAAFLRIHPKTLMRLAREGIVPAYSFSDGVRHHWRFLLSELDTWMRSRVNSNPHHPVRPCPANGRRK